MGAERQNQVICSLVLAVAKNSAANTLPCLHSKTWFYCLFSFPQGKKLARREALVRLKDVCNLRCSAKLKLLSHRDYLL